MDDGTWGFYLLGACLRRLYDGLVQGLLLLWDGVKDWRITAFLEGAG